MTTEWFGATDHGQVPFPGVPTVGIPGLPDALAAVPRPGMVGRSPGWLKRLFGRRREELKGSSGRVNLTCFGGGKKRRQDALVRLSAAVEAVVGECQAFRTEAAARVTVFRQERDAWALMAADAMGLAQGNKDAIARMEGALEEVRAAVRTLTPAGFPDLSKSGGLSSSELAGMLGAFEGVVLPAESLRQDGPAPANDLLAATWEGLQRTSRDEDIIAGEGLVARDVMAANAMRAALDELTPEMLGKPIPADVRAVLDRLRMAAAPLAESADA